MTLLGRLALLFVVLPILELVLLIRIGQWVGVVPTVALVLLTGVGGAMLARAEGLRVLFRFQRELASGRLPGQALLDALSVLLGGVLLLTPGVLSDVAGLSLLVPVTRRWIQRKVRARLEQRITDGTIRVLVGGPGPSGGFRGFGGSDVDTASNEETDSDPYRDRPLDPRKGIVVEPKE